MRPTASKPRTGPTATKSVKHSSHHWKRYAHRKHVRTADKSSTVKKAEEKEVADAAGEVPVSLPPQVANANARIDAQLDEPSGATRAMTDRANAILLAQADNRADMKAEPKAENKPAEAQAPAQVPTQVPAQAPAESQVAAPDQLNDSDRTLQEPRQPTQTVAMAATAETFKSLAGYDENPHPMLIEFDGYQSHAHEISADPNCDCAKAR